MKAARLTPRFVKFGEAATVLGGEQILRDCEAAGWIKPVRRGNRCTIFTFSAIHACADRIEAGEWPRKEGK